MDYHGDTPLFTRRVNNSNTICVHIEKWWITMEMRPFSYTASSKSNSICVYIVKWPKYPNGLIQLSD